MDTSMIYSAALLDTCAGVGKPLLDGNFQSSTSSKDINTLVQSRQEFQIQPTTHTSSIFQQIVDRIVEYIRRCSEGFTKDSDRMFWMQAHHCGWMLIYWLCDTFEAFSELFEAIGLRSPDFHPVSGKCLIISSLLQDDTEFPRKFLAYMNLKPDWALNNIDILLVAIRQDSTTLLNTTVRKLAGIKTIDWNKAWKLAYTHFKWDAMDVLLSAPNGNLYFLREALYWLVETHRWDKLQIFSDFLRLRVKNLINMDHLNPILYDPFPTYPHKRIMYSCAELIYDGSSHDLELFLDTIRPFGVRHSVSGPRAWYLATLQKHIQLAILPALASRKLSPLKLLYEKAEISSSEDHIGKSLYSTLGLEHISPWNTPQYPGFWSKSISPLDLAIYFNLDFEIVEYLCAIGHRFRFTTVWTEGALKTLRLTVSIADARKQNCEMKGIFYQLYSRKGELEGLDGPTPEGKLYGLVAKTWLTTGRIIFEGDCRHLYNITDVSSGLTWQAVQNELYPAELKDAPIPMATSWPTPLSTQENWDDWRLKVIHILEKYSSFKY